MQFTDKQDKIIYDAIRYYQMNKVPLDSKLYRECSQILDALFSKVRVNYVESAYEVDS
jgi:hypothetical protein